jgi:hypothetical protein
LKFRLASCPVASVDVINATFLQPFRPKYRSSAAASSLVEMLEL